MWDKTIVLTCTRKLGFLYSVKSGWRRSEPFTLVVLTHLATGKRFSKKKKKFPLDTVRPYVCPLQITWPGKSHLCTHSIRHIWTLFSLLILQAYQQTESQIATQHSLYTKVFWDELYQEGTGDRSSLPERHKIVQNMMVISCHSINQDHKVSKQIIHSMFATTEISQTVPGQKVNERFCIRDLLEDDSSMCSVSVLDCLELYNGAPQKRNVTTT